MARSLILVGDHSSYQLNLRMTSLGYLTADIVVDFPPLNSVTLDPKTGYVMQTVGPFLVLCNLTE